MSLKDMTQETVYSGLRRFLNSSIGKNWDALYSKICGTATVNSEKGRLIRKAISWYVDTKGSTLIHPKDYYVDNNGHLRKYSEKKSWKTRFQEAKQKEPIIKINFVGDGLDVWFELVSNNPISPYKPKFTGWYQFIRKRIESTYPTYEYVNGRRGKQIGVHPITHEEIHKRQCGSKEIRALNDIAARKKKILKLEYQREAFEQKAGLVAYVPGTSQKGFE